MKKWGKSKGITDYDEEEGPSEKPKTKNRRCQRRSDYAEQS